MEYISGMELRSIKGENQGCSAAPIGVPVARPCPEAIRLPLAHCELKDDATERLQTMPRESLTAENTKNAKEEPFSAPFLSAAGLAKEDALAKDAVIRIPK